MFAKNMNFDTKNYKKKSVKLCLYLSSIFILTSFFATILKIRKKKIEKIRESLFTFILHFHFDEFYRNKIGNSKKKS